MKIASLIRGINVSGKNIVKMVEFRAELEKAGFEGVQTYIQSGNLVSNSKSKSFEEVSGAVRVVLRKKFDVEAPVISFDFSYLREVMEANPYAEEDKKKVAIGFLDKTPNHIDLPGIADEQFEIGNNCIYLFYPSGMGKSKLTNKVIESKMGVVSTMRNLNTCGKILEMLEG